MKETGKIDGEEMKGKEDVNEDEDKDEEEEEEDQGQAGPESRLRALNKESTHRLFARRGC